MSPSKSSRASPLFAAAVLKALLSRRTEGQDAELELYRGILRDLAVSDEDVDVYLAKNRERVEEAIRSHRRGEG